MRTAVITVVACGLVVLSGCTGSGSTKPTLSDVRVAAVLKGAGENSAFLYDAEQQLIARCMRKAGFTYRPGTQEQKDVSDPFRGTHLTSEDARRKGYGLRQSYLSSKEPTNEPNADLVAKLSPSEAKRYQEALVGTPASRVLVKTMGTVVGGPGSGCVGEVRKTIYGDLKQQIRLSYVANSVLGEASHTVESDEALIESRKEWSDCMDKAGFDYDSRREARDGLGKRYFAKNADVDAVFRDEIATATADAKCAQRTGFEKVLQQAQDHASAVAVTKHEGDLVAAKEMNDAAVGRAKKALAGS